ncbi:hypothetical protein CANCADRAFT_85717 [Tortispora caseinolytica NRRL Y-17796]|uniref:RING-type domain-containing protein n=1 Tax=Tortispora caseinolytica NRRL Y-17796 TaxID=767744 RepID=A0A1E4TKT8_9ASCO|nr:hypothetical protein CANCADRAFT_85717 [Tortispora caseinolytica NRRL Y-17796]
MTGMRKALKNAFVKSKHHYSHSADLWAKSADSLNARPMSAVQPNMPCCICHESMFFLMPGERPIEYSCGHLAHRDCISDIDIDRFATAAGDDCPRCRPNIAAFATPPPSVVSNPFSPDTAKHSYASPQSNCTIVTGSTPSSMTSSPGKISEPFFTTPTKKKPVSTAFSIAEAERTSYHTDAYSALTPVSMDDSDNEYCCRNNESFHQFLDRDTPSRSSSNADMSGSESSMTLETIRGMLFPEAHRWATRSYSNASSGSVRSSMQPGRQASSSSNSQAFINDPDVFGLTQARHNVLGKGITALLHINVPDIPSQHPRGSIIQDRKSTMTENPRHSGHTSLTLAGRRSIVHNSNNDVILAALRSAVDKNELDLDKYKNLRICSMGRASKDPQKGWSETQLYLFESALVCLQHENNRLCLRGVILVSQHLLSVVEINSTTLKLKLSSAGFEEFYLSFPTNQLLSRWSYALRFRHASLEEEVESLSIQRYKPPVEPRGGPAFTAESISRFAQAGNWMNTNTVLVFPVGGQTSNGVPAGVARWSAIVETIRAVISEASDDDTLSLVLYDIPPEVEPEHGVIGIGPCSCSWTGWDAIISDISSSLNDNICKHIMQGPGLVVERMFGEMGNAKEAANALNLAIRLAKPRSDLGTCEPAGKSFVSSVLFCSEFAFGVDQLEQTTDLPTIYTIDIGDGSRLAQISHETPGGMHTYVKDWFDMPSVAIGCCNSSRALSIKNAVVHLSSTMPLDEINLELEWKSVQVDRVSGSEIILKLGALRLGSKSSVLLSIFEDFSASSTGILHANLSLEMYNGQTLSFSSLPLVCRRDEATTLQECRGNVYQRYAELKVCQALGKVRRYINGQPGKAQQLLKEAKSELIVMLNNRMMDRDLALALMVELDDATKYLYHAHLFEELVEPEVVELMCGIMWQRSIRKDNVLLAQYEITNRR